MKLLIYSPVFYPSVGGIETVNLLIAQELIRKGYKIIVITTTPNPNNDDNQFNFKIERNPGFKKFWEHYKWCDIYIHSVLSLKAVWPLLIKKKKWIVIHHSCSFYSWDKKPSLSSRLKHFFTKYANNITVSNAVGINLKLSNYKVIWNSYNNQLFRCYNLERRKDFIFVGRLVTEKGVNLLIEAYKIYLTTTKRKFNLTMIGDGPEMENLRRLSIAYGINNNISFKGKRTGNDLIQEMNQHSIMVIPSVCKEAFGIVALEGIACGCFCIASDGDGLQEAIGDMGLLFKKGSSKDLAEKMLMAETLNYEPKAHLEDIQAHLSKYTPKTMIDEYINYIQSYT